MPDSHTPDINTSKFNKLLTLLRELFQLDQPDLDFGIYRIMHAKSGEVTQFLQRDLLPQVKQAFAQYQSADSAELQKTLAEKEVQYAADGIDPATVTGIQKLRQQLKGAVDIGALESDVYDHLFSFFRRYYDEGDFLAKRVYKPGVYAIPYEGEEVTLHWANKDQYYIKTDEYLRDYAFRLQPDDAEKPMRVHFKLVDASEGEHGNVKAAEGKNRVFVLASEDFIALEDGELSLRFEYRPATPADWPEEQREGKTKPPAQKDLLAAAAERILAVDNSKLADWLAALGKRHIKSDGEQADYARLEAHLRRYSARNTFDYFIHKDLGGFLRRELDFYIKNEVMHLDDIESDTAPKVEQYLSKIRVIRKIAGKIIDFLAQLENFQKKLWLKKKFVVETSWCITLGQIPEAFYPEIAANQMQYQEWVELFSIDEVDGAEALLNEEKDNAAACAFLRIQPTLVVDTRHFNANLVAQLQEQFDRLTESQDGVLVNSESFQALTLLQSRHSHQVGCVYLDPPYNTGGDGFSYKDAYQHSSWLSMFSDRITTSQSWLCRDSITLVSINDIEQPVLSLLMDEKFGVENKIANMVWKGATDNNPTRIAVEHEYLLCYANQKSELPAQWSTTENDIKKWMLGTFDKIRETSCSFDKLESDFLEFCSKNKKSLGDLYRYRRLDTRGPYAARRNMDNPGKPGHRYDVIHPITEKACAMPFWGWRFKKDTMRMFVAEDRLIFGPTEEKIPELKVYLRDVKFPLRSVVSLDSRKGSNELEQLFGSRDVFKNPKPSALLADMFRLVASKKSEILDFFAGSGTTGQAIIDLNREDGGRRKFVMIEIGNHFEEVMLPRVKKKIFSNDWKSGKPATAMSDELVQRSPRLIKVIRLESYEDTLNNLALQRTGQQDLALGQAEAQGPDKLKEQYLLRYQLNVETKGSQSLLNIAAFTDPTAYKLLVKTPGSDESREVNVDLLETFNYLIGLTVQHMAAPRSFYAEFERDSEKRLQIKGRLKQIKSSPHPDPLPQAGEGEKRWWFRTVTGTTPEGRRALVIWRKLTGDAEQDNLVLDTWFKEKQAYSVRDTEFDLIWVNGDSTLENLRLPDETWKVRLIEEDFQRLMFNGTEA